MKAKTRRIVIVCFEQVQLFDVAGPADCFALSLEMIARMHEAAINTAPYKLDLASTHGGVVPTSSGIGLDSVPLCSIEPESVDTLIVPGGPVPARMAGNDKLLQWIRTASSHARRVCSVCTGAFILAEAGLLDGRRAVTHWRYCRRLARDYPNVAVEPDAIYIRDGKVWTSAGVSAGVDLSLALVEDDLGRPFATDLARNMVVYFKRSGGQSQYSGLLAAQRRSRSGTFDELNQWIAGHLDRPLGVEELADKAGMSARNFARRYKSETGFTPARFVAMARLDAARSALEQTGQSLDQVARSCGFGSEERMRRSFQRHLGVTPSHHRDHHRDRHTSP